MALTSPQRKETSPSSSRSVEKPAARLWPPPPCLRAIAETSMSPSLERRLTLRAARPAVAEVANHGRHLGALDRAQVIDDPLGHLLSGPGGRHSRRP